LPGAAIGAHVLQVGVILLF